MTSRGCSPMAECSLSKASLFGVNSSMGLGVSAHNQQRPLCTAASMLAAAPSMHSGTHASKKRVDAAACCMPHLLQLDLSAGRVHSNDLVQSSLLAGRPAAADHHENLHRGRQHMHQRALVRRPDLIRLRLHHINQAEPSGLPTSRMHDTYVPARPTPAWFLCRLDTQHSLEGERTTQQPGDVLEVLAIKACRRASQMEQLAADRVWGPDPGCRSGWSLILRLTGHTLLQVALKVRKAWRMTILALPLFWTIPRAMPPAEGGASADSTLCQRESFADARCSSGPCTANHACTASRAWRVWGWDRGMQWRPGNLTSSTQWVLSQHAGSSRACPECVRAFSLACMAL